ncbi:hypothetical protein RHSIM_Rhsim11G0056000 [Rhododendron simsii]|uniref:J domain-containing protein n=1 Tax=Rhododendron simsii TaxID=118357 RepID=A0A834GDW6_RHOSS|nr:hypothetical protein RHSIM_Rhsim11G0056000 [Rhododendron simsii]
MASTATPPASYSLLLRPKNRGSHQREEHLLWTRKVVGQLPRRKIKHSLRVFAAAQESERRQRAPPPRPGYDTRIHWENDEDGWIGGSNNSKSKSTQEESHDDNLMSERFSELLNSSSDSHYQFLGVSAEADLEEIKAAYRRLSKEYHPDTTSLPLKSASEKFMKLREIYDVLSDGEKRGFYDWTLAQEAASREAEKMRLKLEDPYMKEVANAVPMPDVVDRLDGKNMDLSDQALSALTFDVVIILFAICSIVYVLANKNIL